MNIILNIFGWMHLLTFQVLSIIFTVIALLAILMMIVFKYKLRQCYNASSTENIEIQAFGNSALIKRNINICYTVAFITLIIAAFFIWIFVWFNSMAITYGAYENVQLAQSLDEIDNCCRKGFIESTDIPDDLRGNIIIYFKYGCPDCSGIHDSLLAYMDEYNVDAYFISSRSATGKALMEKYPIDEVPSGVYVRKQESKISDTYTEILYRKNPDNNSTNASIFDTDKFYILLYHQRNGD